MRLFLVRHAQSTWNSSDRIQGQADPPLSELGREQARRLGERLRGSAWAGFYSSDLKRAAETAGAVRPPDGPEPVLLPELREIELGAWEGLTREEVAERYPELWERWIREPSYDLPPGGEGAARFESRVRAAVERIFAEHDSGDVLAVTHGGVIQVALGQVVGRVSQGFFPFLTENTSISVLQRNRSRVVVARVNDTCHLP